MYVWLLTQTAYRATGTCGLRITDISCAHYMETRHCLFLGKEVIEVSGWPKAKTLNFGEGPENMSF